MARLPAPLRPLWPHFKAVYTRGTRVVAPVTTRLSRLRGGYLPRDVAWTMEDAATDGGRTWTVRPPETLHRPLPEGHPRAHPAFVEALEEVVPRVAVLELDGGRVLTPHAAVITGAGRLVRELSWYFGTSRTSEHPLYLHPFPPPPTLVPGRLGVLASRGDGNYYHFLHDCLPRLGLLAQCPEVDPPTRWYVPQATAFQRELLDLAGIAPEQRVDSAAVRHVQADTLVLPGLASDIERNPPWVSAFLRERLRPPGLDRVPGRHLYVTRGRARNNRAVLNEDAVLAALGPRGFELVDAGAHPVAEQIRLFAEADVIVAPHGAALANLAFCSPGSAVVELFPAGTLVADYWKMACGVPGLEYRYLCGTGKPAGTTRGEFIVADITVDLPRLLAVVDELLAARDGAPT